MPMNCGELYKDNTLIVEFTGVEMGGDSLNDGTCTVSVLDENGTPLSGGDEIEGANTGEGTYEAILPSTLDLDIGDHYDIVGTITKDGNVATWTIRKEAKKRKGGAGC